MPNIHAINAQGTEYGIEADNGITQAQAEAIATIGDASELSTDAKTTLVAAINEVYGKTVAGAVVYENPSPSSGQSVQSFPVSGLANAKALKITFGKVIGTSGQLEERVFPFYRTGSQTFKFSQTLISSAGGAIQISAREVLINSARTEITISDGETFLYDTNTGTGTTASSTSEAKVLKIVALF